VTQSSDNEFRELERLRERARHNEAAALSHARQGIRANLPDAGADEWTILAEEYCELADKYLALASKFLDLAKEYQNLAKRDMEIARQHDLALAEILKTVGSAYTSLASAAILGARVHGAPISE
jgi:hypothetical protein